MKKKSFINIPVIIIFTIILLDCSQENISNSKSPGLKISNNYKLIINEFMADNESVIENPDSENEYVDWIEIYNADDKSIDIAGMYLTDDLEKLDKCQIPYLFEDKTTITPGGFLLLWADGSPEQGPLHLDFNLSGNGEDIAIVETDGETIIDKLTYSLQRQDVSMGYFPDGSDNFISFNSPSPGKSNVVKIVEIIDEEIEISLFINEFMASNKNTLLDPDDLEESYDDWIEIYNGGNSRIELGGFYITDDLGDPDKWQIPGGVSINSGSYLIIWADNESEEGSSHSNFKLSSDGEEIGLVNKDGITVIDSIQFTAQSDDISYGRFPDGADNWIYFNDSSPGITNGNPTPSPTAKIIPELSAINGKNCIGLFYKEDSTAISYNIYMSKQKGVSTSNYEELINTEGTEYIWRNLENNSEYYFTVTSVYSSSESLETIEVKGVPVNNMIYLSDKDSDYFNIFKVNLNNLESEQITVNSFNIDFPVLSPDCIKICYLSLDYGLGHEIYIMNADGTGIFNLTNNSNFDFCPSWSPDGKKIAFLSKIDNKYEVHVTDFDGSSTSVSLTDIANADTILSWSPDSSKIAFDAFYNGNNEIFIVNTDGLMQPVNITNSTSFDYSPSWSPDGLVIAYESLNMGNRDIFLIDVVDFTYNINATNTLNQESNPSWSLDSSIIVCESFGDNSDIIVIEKPGDLFIIRNLTESTISNKYNPIWIESGNRIIYEGYTEDGDDLELFITNADGSSLPVAITINSADEYLFNLP